MLALYVYMYMANHFPQSIIYNFVAYIQYDVLKIKFKLYVMIRNQFDSMFRQKIIKKKIIYLIFLNQQLLVELIDIFSP